MRILAALCLLACSPPATIVPDDPPPQQQAATEEPDELAEVPGRRPTREEARAIAQLLRIAEEIRGLTFERAVRFRIQSREVITEFVQSKIDDDELEVSRVFYVALGLLPRDLDIRALLISVLGEQIVGYYDHERGVMVVRDDVAAQLEEGGVDRALGEAEMVIVHELVHALQDQRLELGTRYAEERTVDGDNAFASVVEGDATLAMIGHMAAQNGRPLSAITRNPALLRMLIGNSPAQGAGDNAQMGSAPAIVRVPLLSRYVDGLVFCATLHGQGDWSAIDDAHRNPPTTTEQILHPERYLAGEGAVAIAFPEIPELAAAGWSTHDEDTLGELEMGIYFASGRELERDESAAAGWGGDRLRVIRNAAGETAALWFTAWDDEGEAREAAAAARAVAAGDPEHLVDQQGRNVLIVRDLPTALHAPVRAAFSAFAHP
jgi:hypothetical protein